jgi:hypothetical protein
METTTFEELTKRPDVQEEFKQDKYKTGYTGNINQWIRDKYAKNAGSNPYKITGTYNEDKYNNPIYQQAWKKSQEGIDPRHARDFDTWFSGYVNEVPDEAKARGLITGDAERELLLLDGANSLTDADYEAELALHRGIRDGTISLDFGGAPMIGYRPIDWEWAPEHQDIGYHLVDWENLNTDDLINAIKDTEDVKNERLRGIAELNAAREAAVEARKEAIDQAFRESQNEALRERVAGGYVGNSFHSQANMLKNTIGARQNTALEEASARLESLKSLADGRLSNTNLDYSAGIQAGEVGVDRDKFNIQGKAQVGMANQAHMGATDQFNSGEKNRVNQFNYGGLNSTNQFNTSNQMQVDSINASNAGANASRKAQGLALQIDSARYINDMISGAVTGGSSTPLPTFKIVTPFGIQETTTDPSQFGNTFTKIGDGIFEYSFDKAMDPKSWENTNKNTGTNNTKLPTSNGTTNGTTPGGYTGNE